MKQSFAGSGEYSEPWQTSKKDFFAKLFTINSFHKMLHLISLTGLWYTSRRKLFFAIARFKNFTKITKKKCFQGRKSFIVKLQVPVYKFCARRTPYQLFLYEFCKFFQAIYFTTHLWTTQSGGFVNLISNSRTRITLFPWLFKARFSRHSNTT